MVGRISGVPFSFTAHARDIFEYADPRGLQDKVRAAAAVVAISEHGRRHVLDLVGADLAPRVQLIRNGIDLTYFRPRGGEPDGPLRLLAVSRLVEKKGIDVLLRSAALLLQRGHDVRCQVVGDGPLRPSIVALADSLGITDRVELSGSLDASGVLAAYDEASVVVLPCRMDSNGDQDGLPVSLVEAMAVGVPVVSTLVSGIPELIEDGVSGLLVGPDDPTALAAAIERIHCDGDLRRSMSKAGRLVAETYDRVHTTEQLIGALGLGSGSARTISLSDSADRVLAVADAQ
jgi:glycosyltransferase involved in cell wall biosynthesis